MTDKEFFARTVTDESPKFARIFAALPEEKLDHRPHPKSRSAQELSGVMALEIETMSHILKKKAVDMKTDSAPTTTVDAARISAEALKVLAESTPHLSEAEWKEEVKMTMDGDNEWKAPRGSMLWGFLFDLIHHRGQLSTYIRPMGGKVPSIYGPSADDMG